MGFRNIDGRINVSIHAPARGATTVSPVCSIIGMFQSTLPRGERQAQRYPFAVLTPVSIHAPARGATVHLNYTIIITLSEHKFADIKKSL